MTPLGYDAPKPTAIQGHGNDLSETQSGPVLLGGVCIFPHGYPSPQAARKIHERISLLHNTHQPQS